jgi:acetamidase/formamidase
MTIVPAHPLEEAFKLAFQELVLWVEEEYGADRNEAYMLLGQTVEARATQICNPKPTYVCKLKKQFLRAFR